MSNTNLRYDIIGQFYPNICLNLVTFDRKIRYYSTSDVYFAINEIIVVVISIPLRLNERYNCMQ